MASSVAEQQNPPSCARCVELRDNFDSFYETRKSLGESLKGLVRPRVFEAQYIVNYRVTHSGYDSEIVEKPLCAVCVLNVPKEDKFEAQYVGKLGVRQEFVAVKAEMGFPTSYKSDKMAFQSAGGQRLRWDQEKKVWRFIKTEQPVHMKLDEDQLAEQEVRA